MNTVNTNICNGGNIREIRLPEAFLNLAGFSDEEEVTLTIDHDSIVIRKAVKARKKYPSLRELFVGYEGDYIPEEWDVGKSVGKEV